MGNPVVFVAFGVHESKAGLSLDIALFGGPCVPRRGFRTVLGYTEAQVVHDPDSVLGSGVTLQCEIPETPVCRFIVPAFIGRD